MKKLFFGLIVLIVIVLGAVYALLFTSPGNSFVASIIEKKVNEGQKDVNMKVNDFKLTTSSIAFKATLDENSIINIEGKLDLFAKSVDLAYDINVKDLSKLQNITKQKFNGSFSTKGTIKGDQNLAIVEGKSLLASGDTIYNLKLVNFEPSNIKFSIKNAKIQELLYLVDQPIYASGLLSINGDIKNAMLPTLDGTILTKISDGLINNSVINKNFNQKLQQQITYKSDVTTNLKGAQAISVVKLDTSLATLVMNSLVYDINNSKLTSDYSLNVADLTKLYDVTQQNMRGKLKVDGNIAQSKDSLSVDGKTALFDGTVNFNLLNNQFSSKIDAVEIKPLLHMLYYPEIFNSKSNIDIKYNLASKEGTVVGELLNGQFVKNEFSTIINTFAKFDLTREIYEKTELKSDIKENIINSYINMKSENTTITVPSSTLDTKANTINALIQSKIKEYSFDTTVKGELSSPKVSVDTSAFVKQKIEKKIDKYKEKLEEKLGGKIKLNQLFNENNKTIEVAPKSVKIQRIHTDQEIAEAFKKMFGQD
ncbi:hypothetical protein [Halarcobacter ebronensis]|uniref:AsmA-like C-terminal domain-containing protein n=1 Tax=Halarcobacter ebronensis TaxID=1462615 RepID=A0A4Q1AK31_9BACT|nr:hypothetical protein [Halarcobacter ebronensis]QKF81311.1 hypothetical protein AEBR_0812 [Halarcobacter ebronensis]RXK04876.1 hypothetical protein CRV07_09815 [Halarcobacter ebronensis]